MHLMKLMTHENHEQLPEWNADSSSCDYSDVYSYLYDGYARS